MRYRAAKIRRSSSGESKRASVCGPSFSLSSIPGTSKAHLKLWEVGTGRCLRTREEDFKDFCLSQDGLYVMAVSGGDFSLLDIATDKYLRTYTKEEYSTESICLSPDGRYALWCGQMGYKSPTPKLTLWDATTGNAIRDFEGHTDQVVSACLSSDGRYAFSGSKDGTIKLWETSTGKCLHTLPTSAIDSLCVSRDGRYLVSTGSSGCQRLILDWDLAGLDLEDIMPPSAKPYIETFLIQHTPYAAALPAEGEPTAKEIELSLTHEGKAVWTEDDLQDLFYALGCAGMGYIEKAQDFLLKDLWTDDDISTLLWKRQKVEEQNREDEREGEQRARLEELKKSGALKEAGQRAVRDASLRGVAPIDVLKQELLRLGLDENLVLTA